MAPAAAVNTWTDAALDHSWGNANDWSLGHVPTASEVATFTGAQTDNVTLGTNTTVYGLDVQNGYTGMIILTNQTLEVKSILNQMDPSSSIVGGTLTFDGLVDPSNGGTGIFTWGGGSRIGNNAFDDTTINPNATLNITGTITLSNIGFGAYGKVTWTGTGNINLNNNSLFSMGTGGTFTGNNTGGSITSTSGSGRFAVVAGSTFTDHYGEIFTDPLTVEGTYTITKAVTMSMLGGGDISGTVNNPVGAEIDWFLSGVQLDNGANITGGGLVKAGTRFQGLTMNGSATVTNFQQQGSTVTGTGTLTLMGSSNEWTGGTWNGSGSVMVAMNAALQLDSTTLAMQGGWSLDNYGTVTETGQTTINADGGSSFTNNTNATFNIAGSILYTGNGGAVGNFTNSGNLMMNGTGTSKIGQLFTNSGAVQINSGTLEFINDITQTGGSTYLNGGNLRVDGGTGFTISGGTLYGGGTITAATVINGGMIDESKTTTYQTLNIVGTYVQQATGMLMLKIGRNGAGALVYDQLTITGQASLGGGLSMVGNVTGKAGDNAVILNYGSVKAGTDFNMVMIPMGFTRHENTQTYTLTSP